MKKVEKKMKQSLESIRKAMRGLREQMNKFNAMPFDELKIHISKGNKKIGLVHNFSMAPIITCKNCSGCHEYCYDIKAVLQYPNVRTARAENTVMMLRDRKKTFKAIDKYISAQKVHKSFRWHVSGDILDTDYFNRMVKIARKHADWQFWTYTKNYKAVNDWIDKHSRSLFSFWRKSVPSNLVPMYSVWNGMPCPNPHNAPTFTCIQAGMTPDPKQWECPGNCQICLESGHGCPFGESSSVYEH